MRVNIIGFTPLSVVGQFFQFSECNIYQCQWHSTIHLSSSGSKTAL